MLFLSISFFKPVEPVFLFVFFPFVSLSRWTLFSPYSASDDTFFVCLFVCLLPVCLQASVSHCISTRALYTTFECMKDSFVV